MRRIWVAGLAALAVLGGTVSAMDGPPEAESALRERPPEDEVIYFVLPDRFANGDPTNDKGGIEGEALDHGFDPAHKGFYHGGDLAGLTAKLDYIQGMGVTAVWFAPVFQNKPVQGPPGQESAGYHGYWVTDFTSIDPHFGTNEEFKAFVDAAHTRGMKVYMDIITNRTADVIRYAEGDETGYVYRSKGDFPYSRKGGIGGEPINEGFLGDEVQTEENFAKLTDPSYAYTPVVPENERDVKAPAWLNNPIYYHNRGDTTFREESSRHGDFVGLDDVFTEHPRVLAGMIDIYATWIKETGIDGFRIDTARHVNPEFWQTFIPAMLETAREEGIPNFHIFGEVYRDGSDNGYIAQYTRRDTLPTVLDFAFQAAMVETIAQGQGTVKIAEMFDGDVLYEGGEETALTMPTFLGNHDAGRFSTFVRGANPSITQQELLDRVMLGHVMMMTLRGSPTIYSGSEQGFVGDGNDQAAREDMFASLTDSYNDNDLIGTDATTASENYDTEHPLYRLIGEMARIRNRNPALRRGLQTMRAYRDEPGIFALTRHDPASGQKVLLAYNTSSEPIEVNVPVDYASRSLNTLAGSCPAAVAAPGAVTVTLPALGYAVCELVGETKAQVQ
ncbi:alpha-amylase [Erythrobacter longus]|uniref:Alpha-amylase n=1 Tax=Erythrobacter longus TaxID=1044 RepID=A0A074MF71_ERYLO|nr:alpha-amylase family glycosyl hydrolase [Erythrobacter longus]KEO92089.1 alpha-amylase [Erythrobacter longus]